MKRSTIMILAASVVTLICVVTVTGWLMPQTDRSVANRTTTEWAPDTAPAVNETVTLDEPADEPCDTEPLKFVGLHAGTLLCDLSDFNLGLAGLDEPARIGPGLMTFETLAVGDAMPAAVPEPAALALLLLGSTAALLQRRYA